ncbi:hypothetical protein C3L33_17625, partial [Rhododendron williamsianum]
MLLPELRHQRKTQKSRSISSCILASLGSTLGQLHRMASEHRCLSLLLDREWFCIAGGFFINVAVISVTATICSAEDVSEQCNDITLNSASFLLKV